MFVFQPVEIDSAIVKVYSSNLACTSKSFKAPCIESNNKGWDSINSLVVDTKSYNIPSTSTIPLSLCRWMTLTTQVSWQILICVFGVGVSVWNRQAKWLRSFASSTKVRAEMTGTVPWRVTLQEFA